MAPDPIVSDNNKNENLKDSRKGPKQQDKLLEIIKEYQKLSEIQNKEREVLLSKINKVTDKIDDIDMLDTRLEQFSALLMDIKQQISALSQIKDLPNINSSQDKLKKINSSTEKIENIRAEVEEKTSYLDEEIETLKHLLENKQGEVADKDKRIGRLNDRLDQLADEKRRLTEELDKLNSIIDEWKEQFEMLQKLAKSDPRYKVIDALKKHGTLSDIQLAFTLGTSIDQLRKYLQDLIDLELVNKTPQGKYQWVGEDFEEYI